MKKDNNMKQTMNEFDFKNEFKRSDPKILVMTA